MDARDNRAHSAQIGLIAASSIFLLFATMDIVSLFIYGLEYWSSIVDAVLLLMIALYSISVMKTRRATVARDYSVTMACLFSLEFCCSSFGLAIALLNKNLAEDSGVPRSFFIITALATLFCVGGACALASYSGKKLEYALILVEPENLLAPDAHAA